MNRMLIRLIVSVPLATALALNAVVAFALVALIMNPVAGSGVSGRVFFEPVGDQTSVRVTLTGFAPGSVHIGHIHSGTCASTGPVQFMLPAITADANGMGTSATTIDAPLASLQGGDHLVAFHVGPTADTPTASCAEIPAPASAAAPSTLPRAGGMPAALVPTFLLGFGALGAGVYLRRR